MTTLHTGELQAGHSPGMGYGLAWAVVRDPLGALQLRSVGTYGHGGAFGTQGWVDAKKDLVGVLMMQRSGGRDASERNAFMVLAAAAIPEWDRPAGAAGSVSPSNSASSIACLPRMSVGPTTA